MQKMVPHDTFTLLNHPSISPTCAAVLGAIERGESDGYPSATQPGSDAWRPSMSDRLLAQKIIAPRRIRNIGSETSISLMVFCLLGWHVAAQPEVLSCIWLVCTAFNWCNDVLPTILLEQETHLHLSVQVVRLCSVSGSQDEHFVFVMSPFKLHWFT